MNCCITAADTFMNILLQNKKTLTYVTDLSTQTMQREKAHLFETGIEALFFCFNRHLKNMQILGEFVNPLMNFTMPVTDLRGG
jgi:O-acetylhomoserine/O-acetylserine sulfhydrylase-like pyridoxal-dependent enzyme